MVRPLAYPEHAASNRPLQRNPLTGRRWWHQVETATRGPWFLGARFSMLDVRVSVMMWWRPRLVRRRPPGLTEIATALDGDPRLRAFGQASFA